MTDPTSMTVWVCETGDYEQRRVWGVYASPEDAVACIQRECGPPYLVTWDNLVQRASNDARTAP